MYPEISGYCKTDGMFFPTKKIAVICPETRASYQRGMNSTFSSTFRKSTYGQDSICALNGIHPFPMSYSRLYRLNTHVARCQCSRQVGQVVEPGVEVESWASNRVSFAG